MNTDNPGKPKNTRVGSPSLLQGIFPIQESNWDLIYIHNGILLSYNKEGNSAICHNWTLKHYDRRNNSEKHKYYDISYMWDLKTKGLIS